MACSGRHWFTYRGWVGTSSPTCTRLGCDAPNPNYRPGDDPLRRRIVEPDEDEDDWTDTYDLGDCADGHLGPFHDEDSLDVCEHCGHRA